VFLIQHPERVGISLLGSADRRIHGLERRRVIIVG